MGFDLSEWGLTVYLRWKTWRRGAFVGTDGQGNRYYRDRRPIAGQRERRWVVYDGPAEASLVPPLWHAWLHHTTDTPPTGEAEPQRPWQKPHQPNLTGTIAAYRPPGSTLRAGRRAPATGDYQPWVPS
jgi:NADH:ubiquinone oxidoreductase subunit